MDELRTVNINQITSDDVLDIRQELKAMKPNSIKGLASSRLKTEPTEAVERLNPPSKRVD